MSRSVLNTSFLSSLLFSLGRLLPRQKPPLEQLHYGTAFRHAAATPLSSLLLNLEMIEQHRALQESPYLKQAVDSAQRLQKLFHLTENRVAAEPTQTFSVKLALEAALNLVKPLRNQVVLSSHLAFDETLRLTGNKFYFQEAVICTLRNAIEAYGVSGPDQNRVVLVTGRQEQAQTGQDQLKLAFIDGGSGLGWLERSLVFAEGYTSKESGSGFGLVWVKRVVEEYFAGQLQLKSHKGRGTTLRWYLPLK